MKSFVFFASVLAGLTPVAAASAHISLEQGGTHLSRYGDGSDNKPAIKEGPCGIKGGTRGTHIYTYAPGETITVKLVEYIPHPSYFRFAFDDDGDDGFIEPASIKPIDPGRPCPINPGDKCGASDFDNSPTVLMDNLNPHTTAPNGPYTWQVTLPNVECDNCTLQIIQVMEDNLFHGDFNPAQGDPNDLPYIPDIYHQCIDLVLKPGGGTNPSNGGAGNTATGGAGNAATGGDTSTSNSGGSNNGAGGGQTSATGGSPSTNNPGGGGASGSGPSGSGGAFASGTGGDGEAAPGGSSGSCSVGLSGRHGTPNGLASLGLGLAVVARLRRRARAAR